MSERLPLHSAAAGIYLGQRLDPGYAGYWTAECVEIIGEIDRDRLHEAIAATVIDAEALHVRCTVSPELPEQLVPDTTTWRPEIVVVDDDVAAWPRIAAAIESRLAQPADLTSGPLFRSVVFQQADRTWWYIQAHHLVLDGFGYALLFRQVTRRYQGKWREADAFKPLRELVDDDAEYHAGPQAERDRQYWCRRLKGLDGSSFAEASALPAERALRLELPLPPAALSESGATWPHRLLAAVAATMHRHNGSSTPVLGLPVANRLGNPAARIPGMVMNIVPLPVSVSPGADLDAITQTVSEQLQLSRRHQRYRYERLRRDLALPSGSRLFGPVVNVIPFADPPVFGDCRVLVHHLSAGPVDDVSITARGTDKLVLEANPALYTSTELAELGHDLVRVLVLTGEPIGTWRPLPASPAAVGRPLGELLDDHADASTAIVAGGDRLSYAQLRGRVAAQAAQLHTQGVRDGDLVAIALPRGIDAVVAMLAALRLRAGYVPIDPEGAPERNAMIFAEAAPVASITAATPTVPEAAPPPPPTTATPKNTAYVIYTSGSTGRPKGVAIPHSALEYFVSAAGERYGLTSADRVLQFAPLHFDAHVEEIFATLAVGATVVVRDDSATRSLPEFMAFVAEHELTVLDLPTAYWHELALALHNGLVQMPSTVTTVIIGGEAAEAERVAQWHSAVPASVRLINTYGPTEATVVCLAADLAPAEPVSLGWPLPGVSAAIGPRDELYLAGPGLASGYLSMPAGTGFIEIAGQRWYPTGDIVDTLPDGRVTYLGRADEEVKISGHRIHPSEIETALGRHPKVREAVVIVEAESRRLTAHVSADADADELTEHARGLLPAVAVPRFRITTDRLPRTATGKIDRRNLVAAPTTAEPAHARTATEQAVFEVFTEVLGSPPSSLDEDFFAAGGTSLAAVAAASRLSSALGQDVTAAKLFAHPSVVELAAVLTGAKLGDDDTAAMLADSVWPAALAPAPTGRGEGIALTGATGFVGAHLLAELQESTDVPIYCLGRGGTDRLIDVLDQYGLSKPDTERVIAIDTDLSQPGLGLDAAARALVAGSAAIINCAASVNFTRGYRSLRTVNVYAVRSLLELAGEGGSHFHQISTVSVGAGADLPEEFIAAPPTLSDGYQRAKWAAEELVRQAGEAGLPVACHRLGRIVPPAGSTYHNPADLVGLLARTGLSVGALPRLEVREPWLAADTTARYLSAMVRHKVTGAWNLTAGEPIWLPEIWRVLCEQHRGLTIEPLPRWRERVAAAGADTTGVLAGFFEMHDAPPADPAIANQRFTGWLAEHDLSVEVIDPRKISWQ